MAHIQVLGSAAGGGLPQWNCDCQNCQNVRKNVDGLKKRTQSSIIVYDDQASPNCTLINASPDILTQIQNTPVLFPKQNREKTIKNILLMDAQIDHITGLLMLREGCPHDVYCTKEVHQELKEGFPMFDILSHWETGLIHNEIVLGEDFQMTEHLDIVYHPVPLISNAPPYSPYRDQPREGDNIGLLIENKKTSKILFYAPGLGEITQNILEMFAKADVLLIDGTFWTNDEMQKINPEGRTAGQMGHLPLAGKGGLIDILDTIPNTRKILIHINNTNPILDENSNEKKILNQHSIEVSFDGMIIKF